MLEVALSLAFIFFAIYLIGKWKIFEVDHLPRQVFHLMFIIKLMAALALYIIYTRFYTDRSTADIFRYYDDSAVLYGAFTDHPWDFFRMLTGLDAGNVSLQPYYDSMRNWYNTDLLFNDSRTMIRLNAFLRLFTVGTYFPHAVVMCFLSLLGLTGIYRLLNRLMPGRELLLLLLVFMLPSTLIWTSGMIKEALLLFVLGAVLYRLECGAIPGSTGRWNSLFLLVLILAMMMVKAYVFFLMAPVFIIVWKYLRKDGPGISLAAGLLAVWMMAMALASPYITGRSVPELIADKQTEFYAVAERDHAGSMIDVHRLEPSWTDLIAEAPSAFFRTLLLPLPWQSHNILMWFSVGENLLILSLLILFLFTSRKNHAPVVIAPLMALLFFGVTIFVLSGWVAPVIGALVRYKVPGLVFLLAGLSAWSYRPWMGMSFWLAKVRKG